MDGVYEVENRDFYLEYMRRTMERVREKIEDRRREPGSAGGWDEIVVEGQWLEQLIAECVAKHQMLMECQRQLSIAAGAAFLNQTIMTPPLVKIGEVDLR